MRDEFVNRLSMFRTALDTLSDSQHRHVWSAQPPTILALKVKQASDAVANLAAFGRQQEANITGAAERKQRVAARLVEAIYLLGSTLAIWCRDQGDEPTAAKVDFPRSHWARLRDQQLLERARLSYQLAQEVANGEQAADAAVYDITPESVEDLGRAIDDYASVISTIAQRKARTQRLRQRFAAVQSLFAQLDVFILHLRDTSEGRHLVAAYQAARLTRDLGHGRPVETQSVKSESVESQSGTPEDSTPNTPAVAATA